MWPWQGRPGTEEGLTRILLDLPGELALVIEACPGEVAPALVEILAILLQHGTCASGSSLPSREFPSLTWEPPTVVSTLMTTETAD